MRSIVLSGRLVTLIAAIGFTGAVYAQDLPVPEGSGLDRMIGALVVVVPDYEGSDDYEPVPAPVAKFIFHENRYFQLTGNKAYLNVLNHENFELGPMGIVRFGRDDVDNDQVDALSDVDDSFELGGFVGYSMRFDNDFRHRMNVHLDFTQDVTDGHDGYVIEAAGTYWRPVAKRFDLGFRVSSAYASGDYMSSFFDVTPAGSARSGLSVFDADSGIKDVGIGLMGVFHITMNWHIGGGVSYKRLLSDAADSPVTDDVGSENQLFAGIGVIYSW